MGTIAARAENEIAKKETNKLTIPKNSNLEKMFGTLKDKRSTQEVLDEIDKEFA